MDELEVLSEVLDGVHGVSYMLQFIAGVLLWLVTAKSIGSRLLSIALLLMAFRGPSYGDVTLNYSTDIEVQGDFVPGVLDEAFRAGMRAALDEVNSYEINTLFTESYNSEDYYSFLTGMEARVVSGKDDAEQWSAVVSNVFDSTLYGLGAGGMARPKMDDLQNFEGLSGWGYDAYAADADDLIQWIRDSAAPPDSYIVVLPITESLKVPIDLSVVNQPWVNAGRNFAKLIVIGMAAISFIDAIWWAAGT